MIGAEENAGGQALTRERLAGADVAIEFTRPDAAVANLERLIEAGVPDGHRHHRLARRSFRESPASVEQKGGALLHASNLSSASISSSAPRTTCPGDLPDTRTSARSFWRSTTPPSVDAPSGTARHLQSRLRAGDPERAFPITSMRAGVDSRDPRRDLRCALGDA